MTRRCQAVMGPPVAGPAAAHCRAKAPQPAGVTAPVGCPPRRSGLPAANVRRRPGPIRRVCPAQHRPLPLKPLPCSVPACLQEVNVVVRPEEAKRNPYPAVAHCGRRMRTMRRLASACWLTRAPLFRTHHTRRCRIPHGTLCRESPANSGCSAPSPGPHPVPDQAPRQRPAAAGSHDGA
jgi:hypothetical protein